MYVSSAGGSSVPSPFVGISFTKGGCVLPTLSSGLSYVQNFTFKKTYNASSQSVNLILTGASSQPLYNASAFTPNNRYSAQGRLSASFGSGSVSASATISATLGDSSSVLTDVQDATFTTGLNEISLTVQQLVSRSTQNYEIGQKIQNNYWAGASTGVSETGTISYSFTKTGDDNASKSPQRSFATGSSGTSTIIIRLEDDLETIKDAHVANLCRYNAVISLDTESMSGLKITTFLDSSTGSTNLCFLVTSAFGTVMLTEASSCVSVQQLIGTNKRTQLTLVNGNATVVGQLTLVSNVTSNLQGSIEVSLVTLKDAASGQSMCATFAKANDVLEPGTQIAGLTSTGTLSFSLPSVSSSEEACVGYAIMSSSSSSPLDAASYAVPVSSSLTSIEV